MSQSLSEVLLHLVFSTKNRFPYIDEKIEKELFSYINDICQKLECPLIAINGSLDHIHIFLLLNRTIAISDLVSKIKSNSSRWIKTKGEHFHDFSWQSGFSIVSVSPNNKEAVFRYISIRKHIT